MNSRDGPLQPRLGFLHAPYPLLFPASVAALCAAHPHPRLARAGPRRWLRTPSSPPRCLGAPQSPTLLPAPLPRRPAPPRLASTGVPDGEPVLPTPTPTLLSAGRAAVGTAWPVTHGRAASAQAPEPELEHGRRPALTAGPPPHTTGSTGSPGGRGRGRGPPGPRTHQAQGSRSRCHCWGEPLARSLACRASPAHNLEDPARASAVLTRPRSPTPPRTQHSETQLSRRSQYACARGPARAPARASPPPCCRGCREM